MNKFEHFLGIDISKEYFDAVLILNGEKTTTFHNQFANDYKGIKSLYHWLKSLQANSTNTLVCMEHTRLYGKLIIKYLLGFEFSLWVEMSLKIIRSQGLSRGKNDKIDAERIAFYAMKNVAEAKLYTAPKKVLEKVKSLLSLREKLIVTKASLVSSAKELNAFDKELCSLLSKFQKNTIKGMEKDIISIEKQLSKLIQDDEDLATLYKQITSVSGIGKITALVLLCLTNGFTIYSTPKQLACYAGVVPFEYSSGKCLKMKSRVHFMANKKLKKQLHMCALTALQYDPELKEYYQRKVAEGKNKMLVINNIRNKLIHRICACVKGGRMFETSSIAA